jgi:hypothetical protein
MDSDFLAMDGAASGSGGAHFSPYSHGRHDAEKHKLGINNQYDLVGIAATGSGGGSVPERGQLKLQRVTDFFADDGGLWDSRDRNAVTAASLASRHLWSCCSSALPTPLVQAAQNPAALSTAT